MTDSRNQIVILFLFAVAISFDFYFYLFSSLRSRTAVRVANDMVVA